ncbi:MAG: TonB-dependent receptor [Carboxylicivirga sp.]|nr:TonB-dependent receptor [Carboxylicivirga sp.]
MSFGINAGRYIFLCILYPFCQSSLLNSIKMRIRLLVLFLMGSLLVLANDGVRDTVKVEEVEITASRKKNLNDGYRETEVSGIIQGSFSNRTLGELLHHSSNINIRSNGSPGAATSISLRGLGASQTQVNWNGFPINSVTLGSADVSNVMISRQSRISLVQGAGGVAYGSGTFGGAINIDFQPERNLNNIALIDLSLGSFGTYKGAGSYNAQLNKLVFSGTIFGDHSDADFPYYDEIKGKKFKRKNADYHQLGVEQYFSFKPDAYTILKGGFQAQVKDLNLPSIEGAALNNIENQKDSTFRLFLDYKKVFKTSSLHIKGAWFYTDQHYTKGALVNEIEVTTIDSRIKSKSWFGDVNYRIYLLDYLSVDAGVSYNNTTGIVDVYGGSQKDEIIGLIGALKYNNKFQANMALRKEWANSVDSDILLNAGVVYPFKNGIALRSAFSQKFRRPTFNDLYWEPGGNPNLKPENGYSIELGVNYHFNLEGIGDFIADISSYYSPIEDMIVWRPQGALWYAKNYSDVLTQGVDFNLNHLLDFSVLKWQTNTSLAYNKATIERINEENKNKEGQPLYYAPEWTSNINSGFSTHNGYEFNINWHFVSKIFYDDSKNTLEPYWLFGARLAKTFDVKTHQLFAQINVENILDKSYQTIRAYPMPGRMFQLKIKYFINK